MTQYLQVEIKRKILNSGYLHQLVLKKTLQFKIITEYKKFSIKTIIRN